MKKAKISDFKMRQLKEALGCPFCGEKPLLIYQLGSNPAIITCRNTACFGSATAQCSDFKDFKRNLRAALKKWNTRKK